jgi:hypothetical protein
MPDNNWKSDAFNPQQPKIPGVSDAPKSAARPAESPKSEAAKPGAATAPPPPKSSTTDGLPTWITLSIAGVLILIIGGIWLSRRSSPAEQVAPLPAADTSALPPAPAKVVENLPEAPGEVATTEELSKPWAAKKFIFRNQLTNDKVPAMVVHLPGGVYWGVSLREPYGTCEMEWVTDMDKLQNDYGFRAQHPMIADPCSHSLFDLSRYGGGPNGLVRGEIVHGAAVRPPLAIEVREEGKRVIAVRME